MGVLDPLVPDGMETVAQAARRIKRSTGFVFGLIRSGEIKPYKVRGVRETLVKTDELNAVFRPRSPGDEEES